MLCSARSNNVKLWIKAKILDCHCDEEADVLYVALGDSDSALCIEQDEGSLVRIDPESGEVVGFTVIGFSVKAAERVAVPVCTQFALPQDEMLAGVKA